MASQTSIARALNLSQRTVSLCLAGSDKVADATRRRVLAAAKEAGYRPNRSALAMRQGRFNALALLQETRPGKGMLVEGLLQGLQHGVHRRGMHLVVASVPDERMRDAHYLPTVLRESSVDGFLINLNHGVPEEMARAIGEGRLPSVWINSKRPADCVHPDDVMAGRVITEHLLARGHARIAYVTQRPLDGHYSVADRLAGYAGAMASAGLAPRRLAYDDPDWRDAERGMDYLRAALRSPDRPTAVVCYESMEAHRAVLAAYQVGLTVPGDLCVAAVHHRPIHLEGFPVVTLVLPEPEVGSAAVDRLIRRIEGAGPLPPLAVEAWAISNPGCCPPVGPAADSAAGAAGHPTRAGP